MQLLVTGSILGTKPSYTRHSHNHINTASANILNSSWWCWVWQLCLCRKRWEPWPFGFCTAFYDAATPEVATLRIVLSWVWCWAMKAFVSPVLSDFFLKQSSFPNAFEILVPIQDNGYWANVSKGQKSWNFRYFWASGRSRWNFFWDESPPRLHRRRLQRCKGAAEIDFEKWRQKWQTESEEHDWNKDINHSFFPGFGDSSDKGRFWLQVGSGAMTFWFRAETWRIPRKKSRFRSRKCPFVVWVDCDSFHRVAPDLNDMIAVMTWKESTRFETTVVHALAVQVSDSNVSNLPSFLKAMKTTTLRWIVLLDFLINLCGAAESHAGASATAIAFGMAICGFVDLGPGSMAMGLSTMFHF